LTHVTRPALNPIPRWTGLVCALIALHLGAVAASSQGLTAASDGSRLWLLMPEHDRPDAFTILHHARNSSPAQFDRVQMLRGEVRPHSVSARDRTLWIIYSDGSVQTIRAVPSLLDDGWEFSPRTQPGMPAGVSVRAMGVTDQGPWALVRIEDRQTLDAIDQLATPKARSDPQSLSRRRRNIALGLPPGYGATDKPRQTQGPPQTQAQTQTQTQTQTPAPPDTTPAQPKPLPGPKPVGLGAEPDTKDLEGPPVKAPPVEASPAAVTLPVDRLLHLAQGRWQPFPLPEDWPHGAEAWLIAERENADHPTLAARMRNGDAARPDTIEVFRANPDGPGPWSRRSYQPPIENGADGMKLIGVENQLVLVQYRHGQDRVSAGLWVLRGGKALPAGEMHLDQVRPTQWAVLGFGNAAALIAQRPRASGAGATPTDPYRFAWTLADVRGETLLKQTDIAIITRGPMDDLAQYTMLAFVGILVTVLMMAFWRRDASWNRLDLPADVEVADLGRRFLAAAIDMAPGLLFVMIYFGLSVEELMLRWPGNGVIRNIQQMVPGSVVIAVFVTHTTLSELVFARTLGKALTGLRTATLTGTRPRAWQLLVRGLLKTLDLLPWAWLLLMLPVIAPHRQRLGDLVGRTVVITDAPPEPQDNQDDDHDREA
jgi:uncharacterized RDD family membrane protein YckC